MSKVLVEGGSFDQEVKCIAQQQQTSSFNGTAESTIQPTTHVLASAINAHSAKQLDPAGLFSSLFSGLTNCTIKFAPQQLNINIGIGASHQQDEEFDALVAKLPPTNY